MGVANVCVCRSDVKCQLMHINYENSVTYPKGHSNPVGGGSSALLCSRSLGLAQSPPSTTWQLVSELRHAPFAQFNPLTAEGIYAFGQIQNLKVHSLMRHVLKNLSDWKMSLVFHV